MGDVPDAVGRQDTKYSRTTAESSVTVMSRRRTRTKYGRGRTRTQTTGSVFSLSSVAAADNSMAAGGLAVPGLALGWSEPKCAKQA